jgi:integrase
LHFDTKTPAFGIRVGKLRRTWLVVKGKNRTKVALGHYPAISLQDARKRAKLELATPSSTKPEITFPEALEAFLGQSRWRLHSKRVLASSLKHFTWKRLLSKITPEDVIEALDAIQAPSARAHALKDVRSFFNWCIPRYLSASPAQGIKMEKQPTRDRVLTDDELVRVWKAAEQIGHPFGTIVMLLILTGQRRTEIGSLKWDYIKNDRLTLPPAVTKNGREHSFPLGTLAISTLNSQSASARQRSATYLFPAHGKPEGSFKGWSNSLSRLHKLSTTSDWTLHDLRRTFATNLAALNVPIHVTEKLLNHISGTTGGLVGIYQRHQYWDEQVDALRRWEERVQFLARQSAGRLGPSA